VEVIASNLITRNVSAQLEITKKLIGEHAVAGAFCCPGPLSASVSPPSCFFFGTTSSQR